MAHHALSWRDAALACACVLALVPLSRVDAAGSAQWTPAVNWATAGSNAYAVHMVLMAGDGTSYHSRILWFRGHGGSGLQGGEWGWNWQPGNEDCTSYPSGNFTALNPQDPSVDIFCSGHAGLWDGRIVLPGGTQPGTGSYGENASRVFTPGAGSAPGTWSNPGNLAERRWYPSATTLRDGRVSALGGYKYPHQRIHGGRIDGAAPASGSGDLVHRFDPIVNGSWDVPVLPEEDPSPLYTRPEPRESHTAVDMTPAGGAQVWFGGRRADGAVLNDVWRLERPNGENVTAADYTYRWVKANPAAPFGRPDPRAEHTAVYDHVHKQMLVFGGCDASGNPVDTKIWRLWWNTGLNPANYQWDEVFIGGTPPAARFAHTALFDEITLSSSATVNRMIVYGGATVAGTAPTDQKVYELRFSSASQATWSEMTETTLPGVTIKPAPRMGHASGVGTLDRATPGHALQSHTAYVYGGQLSAEAYSDTLWTMWLIKDGTYAWQMLTTTEATSGAAPGPRARYSLIADPAQGGSTGSQGPRLYLFGGDNAGVLADRFVHVIDPYRYDATIPAWENWDAGGVATTRHAAVLDRGFPGYVHARVAEVYDPNVGQYGQWSSLPNSNLLQHSYPIVFTISGGSPSGGGRLFTPSAENDVAHYLDLPAPGGTSTPWVPLSNGAVGFAPQSGVLFGPNKVMVGGGRGSGGAVGTTLTRDVSNLSNPWVTSAAMTPRYFHNLVLLPGGKVVVVGGNGTTNQNNDAPIYHPQIWDPAGNGGLGTWTAPGDLPSSTKLRGYHSTALLLPDGRVLVSGGENTEPSQGFNHEKYTADIFCPPYLFNANGSLANRPVLASWPRRVAYGERFAVCVGTDTATVASIALVRPAAVTHGFDENQRYVPLTATLAETASDGQQRFTCALTADSSIAPPGDYMLFVVNGAGTPGLAQWVRVGATNGDTERPRRVEDIFPVAGSWAPADSGVTLTWPPPAEDSLGSCKGPAAKYELRYRKISPIASWSDFAAATLAPNLPVPGEPGGPAESYRLRGLEDGFPYYVRLVAKDYSSGSGNWSAMSGEALVDTPSSGGGEGGGDPDPIQHLTTGESFATFGAETGAVAPVASTEEYVRNTLFPYAPAGVVGTDRIALVHGPRWVDGRARVRIGRWGRGATRLRAVRLLAVDHAAGEAFLGDGGAVAGTRAPAARIVDGAGADWTARLAAGTPFESRVGDVLGVTFADARAAQVYLRASGAQVKTGARATGIDVQARVSGEWTTIGHVDGREQESDGLVSAPATSELRLVFRGNHRLHGVGRVEGSQAVAAQVFQPVAYVDGASAATGASLGAELALLAGGEHVLVEFAPAPETPGLKRDWFLEAAGEEADTRAASSSMEAGRAIPELADAPTAFALSPFHPNPASGIMRAEVALPRSSDVRVEIFDLLGRRVATLVDTRVAAGRLPVVWDGATSGGTRARAGVYLCRMTAGEFRARRTIVLRP
jgi:hypothetical protein